MRDPHQGLKTQVQARLKSKSTEFVLAVIQWGKEDQGLSLHAQPHTFTTAGFQVTDYLSVLGFHRDRCPFVSARDCYWHWVDGTFDLNQFAESFDRSFELLSEAEKDLQACGFLFDQSEGWGYFFGKSSGRQRIDYTLPGDGHTARSSRLLKESEDDVFWFKFTFLENDYGKGWVIHYRPKHPPLSTEIDSVFAFLGLKSFRECPEFSFETCNWSSFKFMERGDDIFNSNTELVNNRFDAHSERFSPGLKKLLTANALIEKVGLRLLPIPDRNSRLSQDLEKRTGPAKFRRLTTSSDVFDVAISFAGTERKYAEELAVRLRDAGFSVFYDQFYEEYLWGKDLGETFDEIYRKWARYCVIFVSTEYNKRQWTIRERMSATARAIQEKGQEYILPINLEDIELPGIPPTVGYVHISTGIDRIAELLIKKLQLPA